MRHMRRNTLLSCVPKFTSYLSLIDMSAPNPNNPYYAAYATRNPSAYDYLQCPPPYDAFVDSAMPMAFNDCTYGTTQPFFTSDNFFPTTTPEFHSNETNYVQSVGSSGSR